jgi:hypothetical protein
VICSALVAILDKRNHPVLIHCNKGKVGRFTRTPSGFDDAASLPRIAARIFVNKSRTPSDGDSTAPAASSGVYADYSPGPSPRSLTSKRWTHLSHITLSPPPLRGIYPETSKLSLHLSLVTLPPPRLRSFVKKVIILRCATALTRCA